MSALVTAFLIVSASSQAQSATPPAAPAAPAAPAVATAPEKKICRKEQEIGSIMPKRTCRTQAEWNAHPPRHRSRHRYAASGLPLAALVLTPLTSEFRGGIWPPRNLRSCLRSQLHLGAT